MIGVLVASLPFVFPGGDIGSLARALAASTHRTTVALVQGEHGFTVSARHPEPEHWPLARFAPFQFDLQAAVEQKDLPRILRVKAPIDGFASPGTLAIWDRAWSGQTVNPTSAPSPLPAGWTDADSVLVKLSNGTVSVALPPNQSFTLKAMSTMGWSKPLRVHWLLAKMRVVPCASGASEANFLGCVAKAVSGRLVDTKQEYRIDLDPQAFRPRVLATIDALAAQRGDMTPILAASFRFRTEGWRSLDDASIQDLFSQSHKGIFRDVAEGTPLGVAVSRWMALYREKAETVAPTPTNETQEKRDLLKKIDWSQGPQILISQNMGLSVTWRALGGGTIIP